MEVEVEVENGGRQGNCCVCGNVGGMKCGSQGVCESPVNFLSGWEEKVHVEAEAEGKSVILWPIHIAYKGIVGKGELPVKIHAHFPEVPKSRLVEEGSALCTKCFQVIFKVLQLEKQMLRMKAKLNVSVGSEKERGKDSKLVLMRKEETELKASTSRKVEGKGPPSKGRSSNKRKLDEGGTPQDRSSVDIPLEVGYQTRAKRRGAFAGLSKEIIKAELEEDDHDMDAEAETQSDFLSVENKVDSKTKKDIRSGGTDKIKKGSRPRLPKRPTMPKRKGRKKKVNTDIKSPPNYKIEELEEQQRRKASTVPDNVKFFCCPRCCSYFGQNDYSSFLLHTKDQCNIKKRYPCKTCGHIFTTRNVLSSHIKSSHEKPNPQSKTIRVKPRADYLSDMTRIYENRHKSTVTTTTAAGEGDNDVAPSNSLLDLGKMKSELEESKSNWPDDQSSAESLGHTSGVWKCHVCFYSSTKRSLWLTHVNRIHSASRMKSLTCQYCKFPFTQKHHLREHLHEAHPDRLGHTCGFCGRKLLHKKSPHTCSEIKCHLCETLFETRGEKSKHLLTHPDYRPYSCGVCDKKFQKKEYLSLHMRVHNDERRYPCDLCPKRFRSKTHYNNHRRLHTGEKPYVCHACGKAFTSPQCLRNHLQTGHEEKKEFACSICGKEFRTAYDVKRHEGIHTDLKPFQCKICDKTFNRKGNCLTHEQKHMKKEQVEQAKPTRGKRNRRKSKAEPLRMSEEVTITAVSHSAEDDNDDDQTGVMLDEVKNDSEELTQEIVDFTPVPVVFTVIS